MESARRVTSDIEILPSYLPLPGLGLIPVNAFVLKAREPVLVDTGMHQDHDAFLSVLRSVIDPRDLRWLWLTHPDQDHVGSLQTLLAEVPHLKVITTFLGYGILSLTTPPPLDRVYLLNPGESLDLGDRQITAFKPPTYDNPATTGFYDPKSRALFSSDSFGAVVQTPVDMAGDIAPGDLEAGQTLWTTIDSPWLHKSDRTAFERELNVVREMDPLYVLSSHLPPARSQTNTLLTTLAGVPDASPFVGPNQAALEAMLATMTGGAAVSV